VRLAEGFPSFGEETLTFEILVAFRAFEALAVVVIVECFDPSVTCFNREAASDAFRSEQVVPISFTIW